MSGSDVTAINWFYDVKTRKRFDMTNDDLENTCFLQ